MPRYELVEGTSSKFWEIERAKKASTYNIRWGRIGTNGQTQVKKLTPHQYDRLVYEKVKKGYTAAGGAPAKPRATTKPAAGNAKLEDTVYEAIEDKDRWLVYADWLQQQQDVRGDIIALSLGGKKAAAKKLAAKSIEALWGDAAFLLEPEPFANTMFTPNWKGAKPMPIDVAFSHTLGAEGMIESVTLSGLDEDGHTAKAIHSLLTAPIGRFVRSITIEAVHDDRYSGSSGQPSGDAVVGAISRAKPTGLRAFAMYTGGWQRSWTFTGDLTPMWKVTPYLERVELEMGNVELGRLVSLPRLASLTIKTGGLDRKNLLAIGKAKWPALEQLTLYLGRKNYGGNAKRADVAALLADPARFPKLTSLGICNAEIQSDVVDVIVKSPIRKQLASLDLSKGTLVDDQVAVLVQNLAAFPKLELLDLSENYLTAAFEKTLKKALGKRYVGGDSRYDEMVSERAEYGHEDWAKGNTFRYAAIGE